MGTGSKHKMLDKKYYLKKVKKYIRIMLVIIIMIIIINLKTLILINSVPATALFCTV